VLAALLLVLPHFFARASAVAAARGRAAVEDEEDDEIEVAELDVEHALLLRPRPDDAQLLATDEGVETGIAQLIPCSSDR